MCGPGSWRAVWLVISIACFASGPAHAGWFSDDPPPPLLEISARQCPATGDFFAAPPLAFDPKHDKQIELVFDNSALCMTDAGVPRLYRVYALPVSDTDMSIQVNSLPEGNALFRPVVALLDSAGTALRTFAGDDLIFRGTGLGVMFRPHVGERYLLIESDSRHVGESVSRIQESTMHMPMAAGGWYFAIHTGKDEVSTLVYAYNGILTVTVSPIPAK